MIYPSVVSAVVRAMAAEVMGSVAQCWRDPREPRAPMRAGEIPGAEEATLTDCWVHGRLHRELPAELWLALVAKYSTDLDRKREAMLVLAASISSPAPARFVQCAVATWAFPKRQGAEGKRSTSVLPAGWYEMMNWDDDGRPESTLRRWRGGIRRDMEDRVNQALVAAQEVLDAEGLIRREAA